MEKNLHVIFFVVYVYPRGGLVIPLLMNLLIEMPERTQSCMLP